jgi:hypothetical protein
LSGKKYNLVPLCGRNQEGLTSAGIGTYQSVETERKHLESFTFLTFQCKIFVLAFPLVSCLITLGRLDELLQALGVFIETLESTTLLFLLITCHY